MPEIRIVCQQHSYPLIDQDSNLTSVAARVELRGLGDGQAVVVGLDEPRLGVEVDPPAVLEPVDLQAQVGVGHGVAAEGGGVPRLNLVRLRPLKIITS